MQITLVSEGDPGASGMTVTNKDIRTSTLQIPYKITDRYLDISHPYK